MPSNRFRCRYTAEVAHDMLNEDFDASDPEEEAQEDIATAPTSVDEPFAQSVTGSDSSNDDDDSSGNVNQSQLHTSTNVVTWAPLHIARGKPASAANVFRVKAGVHSAIRRRVSISPNECWKLFIDNNMLKVIQTHTNKEASKTDSKFLSNNGAVGSIYCTSVYKRYMREKSLRDFSMK